MSILELKEKAREILLKRGNEELLIDTVNTLNEYSDSLEYLNYYENDEEFFGTFFANNTMEAIRAISYGNYYYHDVYVRFNDYGNLESCSEKERMEELRENIDEIIEVLIEYRKYITVNNTELQELLEEEIEEEE